MGPRAPVTATTILCMMGRYLVITNDKNTMERWNGVFLLKLLIVGGLVIVFSSSGRRVPAGRPAGLGGAKAANHCLLTIGGPAGWDQEREKPATSYLCHQIPWRCLQTR